MAAVCGLWWWERVWASPIGCSVSQRWAVTCSHSKSGIACSLPLRRVLCLLLLWRLLNRRTIALHPLVWKGVEEKSNTSWGLGELARRLASTRSFWTCVKCWRKGDTSLRSVRWSGRVQPHDQPSIGHLVCKWDMECSLLIGSGQGWLRCHVVWPWSLETCQMLRRMST